MTQESLQRIHEEGATKGWHERIIEQERHNLEKLPDQRLRNVLLSFTAFVALVGASPVFGKEGGEPPRVSVEESAERGAREWSDEELIVKKEIEDSFSAHHIEHAAEKEFFSFVRDRNVPLHDLKEALLHRHESSDPLMLLQAYAVAFDAVSSKSIGEKHRRHFQDFILPNLRNGVLIVEKKEQDKFTGASYDSERDAYMDTKINVFDVEDRGITIHELVHAYQDGAKLSHKREDSELEAYVVQGEYVLQQKKLVIEQADGSMRISVDAFAKGIFEKFSSFQQVVLLNMVIRNIEHGRNDLNMMEIDGIMISEIEDQKDAKIFCESQRDYLVAKAKLSWSMSTAGMGMAGGKIVDITEILQKDGFKRLPHESRTKLRTRNQK